MVEVDDQHKHNFHTIAGQDRSPNNGLFVLCFADMYNRWQHLPLGLEVQCNHVIVCLSLPPTFLLLYSFEYNKYSHGHGLVPLLPVLLHWCWQWQLHCAGSDSIIFKAFSMFRFRCCIWYGTFSRRVICALGKEGVRCASFWYDR